MSYFEVIPWDNPWLGPVSTGAGGLGDEETYITVATGSPPGWQAGVVASNITIYLTLDSARTVTVYIDDNLANTVGGDVFILGAGPQVLSCDIVSQPGDLAQITLAIPGGNWTTPDTLTDIVVTVGAAPTSEFWTSFTKSYEIS